MSASTADPVLRQQAVTVRVSDDRMLAELDFHPTADASSIILDSIKAAMSAANLQLPSGEDLTRLLHQHGWPQYDEPMVIARGTVAVDDTRAELQMLNEQPVPAANAAVSNYDRHCFVTTVIGQTIARIMT